MLSSTATSVRVVFGLVVGALLVVGSVGANRSGADVTGTHRVGTDRAPAVTSQSDDDRSIVLLVDLSGSMNEGSPTKLDQSKQALGSLLSVLPPATDLGLRVYGADWPSVAPARRAESCRRDTRSVVPIGPVTPDVTASEIGSLEARGDTPIALGLNSSAEDLNAGLSSEPGATGRIILVSDGRDECHDADLDGDPASGPSFGPDPCRLAADLHRRHPDLRIDSVGFLTGDSAEAELRCIAEAGGGAFVSVTDADSLLSGLSQLLAGEIQRAAPSQQATMVEGSPDIAGAPRLGTPDMAAGLYRDRIAIGETAVYRAGIEPSLPFYVTATVFDAPPPPRGEQNRIGDDAPSLEVFVISGSGDDVLLTNRRERIGQVDSGADATRIAAGWLLDRDPNEDVYIGVRLTGEPPEGASSQVVELHLEGTGFGGRRPGCPAGARCEYLDRVQSLELAAATLGASADQGGEELSGRRLLELQSSIDQRTAELSALTAAKDLDMGSRLWPRWVIVWAVVAALAAGFTALVGWRLESLLSASPLLVARDEDGHRTVAGARHRERFVASLAERPRYSVSVRVVSVALAVTIVSLTLVAVSSAGADADDEPVDIGLVSGGADFRSATFRPAGVTTEQVTVGRPTVFAVMIANDQREFFVDAQPVVDVDGGEQPRVRAVLYGPDLEPVVRQQSPIRAVPFFGSESDRRELVWYVEVTVDSRTLEGLSVPVRLEVDGVVDPAIDPCDDASGCHLDEEVDRLENEIRAIGAGEDGAEVTVGEEVEAVRLDQLAQERALVQQLDELDDLVAMTRRQGTSGRLWYVLATLAAMFFGGFVGWRGFQIGSWRSPLGPSSSRSLWPRMGRRRHWPRGTPKSP